MGSFVASIAPRRAIEAAKLRRFGECRFTLSQWGSTTMSGLLQRGLSLDAPDGYVRFAPGHDPSWIGEVSATAPVHGRIRLDPRFHVGASGISLRVNAPIGTERDDPDRDAIVFRSNRTGAVAGSLAVELNQPASGFTYDDRTQSGVGDKVVILEHDLGDRWLRVEVRGRANFNGWTLVIRGVEPGQIELTRVQCGVHVVASVQHGMTPPPSVRELVVVIEERPD
ncbi:MAG: hypothetical protein U0136_14085 [Bdellovibrionota bacterium]